MSFNIDFGRHYHDKQHVAQGHKNFNHFTIGDTMHIFRSKSIPNIYTEIPFIREGKGAFVDLPSDTDRISFFRECAEGKRCISDLDTQNRIIIMVKVPSEVINGKEHTGEIVEWLFYFWKPGDKKHASEPGKYRPFEGVDLERAGIGMDYLFSISEGLPEYG